MDCSVATRRPAITGVLILLAAIVILAHPGAQAQAPATAPKAAPATAGNAQNGKRLLKADGCYECHGYEGQGGQAGTGPRIGPPQLPLAGVLLYVRAPKGVMPPYTTKVLSDADLRDIYAFLQSIPKPPPVKSIPLLNQ